MFQITSLAARSRKTRSAFSPLALALLLAGTGSLIGAANAATARDEAPSITVRFNPTSLETTRGAQQLYNRLADAAAELYPSPDPHFVPTQVREWREQAVARAVLKINNPKLVAVYNSTTEKSG
jgi:UrcA family protein